MREGLRGLALAIVLIGSAALADPRALETDDPRALDAAVAAIEHGPANADDLFEAGRACEDKLLDPARALAIYDRLVRELPSSGVAVSAARRAERLRAEIGNGHAAEAAALAKLVAEADRAPPDDVISRADALAHADWPGAPDAGLWLAEWLRRHGRYDDAARRYRDVSAGWPGSSQATLALRGEAGCAIDAHDWSLATTTAERLPAIDPADRAVRDELIDAAATGRRRDHIYRYAWVGLVTAFLALIASLLEAALFGGRRRPRLRPPVEVLFLAPIAAVLVAVSFTANRAIAPAVLRISVVGVAAAWLSGTTLDLLRARGRPLRARAIAHVAACVVAVVAIAYIAMTRDGLLEMLAETVRFGPGDQ